MAYNNTGEVHHGGVANEKDVCAFLTEQNHYGCAVVHQGGTKQVEDGESINGDKVSIKRWKGATHDWFNSTPAAKVSGFKSLIEDFIATFKEDIKEIPDADHYTFRKQKEAELNTFIAEQLDNICSEEFAFYVLHSFAEHTEDMDVVISDVKNSKLHIYKFNDHPAVKLLNKGYTPTIISKSGKLTASRSIFMINGDEKVDVGLRVRFSTNNGLKPYTNEGSPNKSTTPVVKLQQDDVAKLLQSVEKVSYNL